MIELTGEEKELLEWDEIKENPCKVCSDNRKNACAGCGVKSLWRSKVYEKLKVLKKALKVEEEKAGKKIVMIVTSAMEQLEDRMRAKPDDAIESAKAIAELAKAVFGEVGKKLDEIR